MFICSVQLRVAWLLKLPVVNVNRAAVRTSDVEATTVTVKCMVRLQSSSSDVRYL